MPARSLYAACLIVACAASLLACGEKSEDAAERSDTTWQGQEIVIGSVYSTSGPGAAFGPQQLDGARLAVEEIDAAGGIRGARLRLRQIDDRSRPAQAARAARELIAHEEALAVLGPTFSNSATEAHPLADRLGVAMLATSNTGPGIVGDCDYPCELVFRDALGEEQAIPANVESFAAAEPDAESAVVVHPAADPFGESTAEIAVDALEDEGIGVLDEVTLPASPQRTRSALRGALRERPDVLFITASSGDAAAALIDAARRGGFAGDVLGGNAFNSAIAASRAGREGEGARSAAAWYEAGEEPANVSFVDAYRDRYGEDPDQFAAQAYTGVLLLAEAARSSELGFEDLAADRQTLAEALAEVRMPTPLGEFAFTDEHDVSQPIWIVAMDGRGDYELIEQLEPSGP
jgi:branched-chain amino acid transport system substrate-binding protein